MKQTAIQATGVMVLGLALLLSGCATTIAPVEDQSVGSTNARRATTNTQTPDGVEVFPAQNAPLSQQSIEPMATNPGEFAAPHTTAPQSPAVVALVDNANRQAGSGELDGAAAALERALRIEPRNAGLWQRLADIRLRQNQPGQAESLALKSNTLAVGDKATQAGNWRIIAKARRMRDDVDGAHQADSRADALIGRDAGSAN